MVLISLFLALVSLSILDIRYVHQLQRTCSSRRGGNVETKELMELMYKAVEVAENNKRNYGILSETTSSPADAYEKMKASVVNNYIRWMSGMQPAPWIKKKPKKYVDFMQSRYAPIGAENDPDNLNVNWAPNVRSYIKKSLNPEQWRDLENMNFVQAKKNTHFV